jgi:hypothetical protein
MLVKFLALIVLLAPAHGIQRPRMLPMEVRVPDTGMTDFIANIQAKSDAFDKTIRARSEQILRGSMDDEN